MGVFGNLIGQGLGNLAGGYFGQAGTGQTVGGALGSLLPFARGGRVTQGNAPRPVSFGHKVQRFEKAGLVQPDPVYGYAVGGKVFTSMRVVKHKRAKSKRC